MSALVILISSPAGLGIPPDRLSGAFEGISAWDESFVFMGAALSVLDFLTTPDGVWMERIARDNPMVVFTRKWRSDDPKPHQRDKIVLLRALTRVVRFAASQNPQRAAAAPVRCILRLAALAIVATLATSCDYTTRAIVGGTVGTTILGARSPSHEIEQIYYLGVFDPREQVPEAIYRVTVKGQASFISFTKFASGWVPAAVIDSLGGNVQMSMQAGAGVTITGADPQAVSQLQTGRRLVLFGPEGFREAPHNHRLVIVMGTSPEEFFKAIDTSLGEFAQVQLEKDNASLQRELMQALIGLRTDQKTFTEIELETVKEFK